MTTWYVGDLSDSEAVAGVLREAGLDVSMEKPPLDPGPGDLAVVTAETGVTSSLRHELTNPLTAVLGFLQLLLRREDLTPDVLEKLQKIYDHGVRVRNLLRKPEGPG